MSNRLMGLVALAIGIVSIAMCCAIGTGDFAHGTTVVLARLFTCGWPSAVYLVSGVGLARLLRPAFKYSGDPTCLQIGCGLAVNLFLSHLLGVLGVLHGVLGQAVTVGIAAVGLGLLAHQLATRRHAPRAVAPRAIAAPEPGTLLRRLLVAILATVPVAALLTAACIPPGLLWSTEFGGYDALSYHLQLPQEWLARGRLEPLAHNVYSYLPGWMEAAYLHLAAMTGAPVEADDAGRFGLLAGSGWRAMSCQLLHAHVTLAGAWCVARMVRRMLVMGKATESTSSAAAWLSGALVLATPWTLVVGSLAYNEMALVALFACACMAAVDAGPSPYVRGGLAGLLVGAACGAKPTALLFAGVPVAILLLGTLSPRVWHRAIVPGVVAGAVMVAPWLWRNYEAGGNPVFPAMAGTFGGAHWSGEQVARFTRAHQFSGTVRERIALAYQVDTTDPAGARHRGLMHPQWGILFPMVLLSIGVGAVWARARLFVLLLGLGLLGQLVLWMTTTHIQSRFLMPMIVPGVALCTFAFAGVREGVLKVTPRDEPSPVRDVAFACLWLPLLAQVVLAMRVYAREGRGGQHPNAVLASEPALTARMMYDEINAGVPSGSRLLLIGEAMAFYRPKGTLYNTTWDEWIFAQEGALKASGATHAIIELPAIARLVSSKFSPPDLSIANTVRWMQARSEVVSRDDERGWYLVRLREGAEGR